MNTTNDELVAPGDFLAEWMEDYGVSVEQLSDGTGFSVQELEDFLDGGLLIDGMADGLARATGVPSRIWDLYQRGLSTVTQNVNLQHGIITCKEKH